LRQIEGEGKKKSCVGAWKNPCSLIFKGVGERGGRGDFEHGPLTKEGGFNSDDGRRTLLNCRRKKKIESDFEGIKRSVTRFLVITLPEGTVSEEGETGGQ